MRHAARIEARLRVVAITMLTVVSTGCGERSQAQTEARVQEMAEEIIPDVERAVGLPFTAPPQIAMRSRAQVRAYLDAKIASELPPEEIERLTIAYRLFGLIPDTLDLAQLLLDLYTEQVAGYYDPDSTTLYVVEGSDPAILRFTIAHELVHALQDQYMPLDSIMSAKRQNDRKIAAQAVLEGQATLSSLLALLSGQQSLDMVPNFWTDAERRRMAREQQQRMPVFAAAPLVIRDGLIFPYLAGADFVRWFTQQFPDTVPYGERLPESTEQILHPDRYREGDRPVALAISDADRAVYDDDLGEFETRILLTELTDNEFRGRAGALDWDGDRYVVLDTPDGRALVWWSVWDHEQAATRFSRLLETSWMPGVVAGRRASVEQITIDGLPGVRLVDAPERWERWERLPEVRVGR